MRIGAIKGIKIDVGFAAARMTGSQNNDPITETGFASIAITQQTIDKFGHSQTISAKGRHDISAILRINIVCEAMANFVIADHLLRQRTISD